VRGMASLLCAGPAVIRPVGGRCLAEVLAE
jgi:hypothetical protein